MRERVLHCWKDYGEYTEERYGFGSEEWTRAFRESKTCMLERNHEGEHEWTPDDEIRVTFGVGA